MRGFAAFPADQRNGQNHLLRGQGAVMNALSDQVDGEPGFLLQIAIDGADGLWKIDIAENVVKSDDAESIPQADPVQQGDLRPGFHIAEGEDPGHLFVFQALQTGDDLLLAVSAFEEAVRLGDTPLAAGADEALPAFLGGIKHRVLGEHGDLPVAVLDEMPPGEIAALLFVADDAVVLIPRDLSAQHHIGDAAGAQHLHRGGRRVGREDQHPVHLPAQGHLQHADLHLRLVLGAEDHQRIPQAEGFPLQQVRQDRVERIGHVPGDHGDGLCPSGAEGTGDIVADIPHLPGYLLDILPGLHGNVRFVLQRAGDGVGRIAGRLCHVLERDPSG